MKILVTGTPGSGKTTLSNYAKSVGDHRFFDADEVDELCEWRRFDTGEVIGSVKDEMGNLVESGEDDWYKVYGWYWRKPVMQELLEKNDDVILCGSSENIVDFYGMFDKIVILKVDEDTLLEHLSHPTRNNPFGQTAEQRKNFMGWQDYLLNEAERYKPTIVEAKNIHTIFEAVINETKMAEELAIPIYEVSLPDYRVVSEPNHKVIGKVVDDCLREHFLEQTVVVRGISSVEHDDKTTDELIEIIRQQGTDRYDPKRIGDRYENIQGKHIDFFAFRRKITENTHLFKDLSWGFYHGSIAIHGKPVRLDILTIYDASQLKAVVHQYEGRDDVKRDGFIFKNPQAKVAALKAIIKITD